MEFGGQNQIDPHRRVISMGVGSISENSGFTSISRNALETLTEMMVSLMNQIGQAGKDASDLSGRTIASSHDVAFALVDSGISLEKLMGYKWTQQIWRRKPLPVPGKILLPTEGKLMKIRSTDKLPYTVQRNKSIPDHYPPFPPPHTYLRTALAEKPTPAEATPPSPDVEFNHPLGDIIDDEDKLMLQARAKYAEETERARKALCDFEMRSRLPRLFIKFRNNVQQNPSGPLVQEGNESAPANKEVKLGVVRPLPSSRPDLRAVGIETEDEDERLKQEFPTLAAARSSNSKRNTGRLISSNRFPPIKRGSARDALRKLRDADVARNREFNEDGVDHLIYLRSLFNELDNGHTGDNPYLREPEFADDEYERAEKECWAFFGFELPSAVDKLVTSDEDGSDDSEV